MEGPFASIEWLENHFNDTEEENINKEAAEFFKLDTRSKLNRLRKAKDQINNTTNINNNNNNNNTNINNDNNNDNNSTDNINNNNNLINNKTENDNNNNNNNNENNVKEKKVISKKVIKRIENENKIEKIMEKVDKISSSSNRDIPFSFL